MTDEWFDHLGDVTRVDLIVDSVGVYQKVGVEVSLFAVQDEGKTLKLFLRTRDDNGASVDEHRRNLIRSFERPINAKGVPSG